MAAVGSELIYRRNPPPDPILGYYCGTGTPIERIAGELSLHLSGILVKWLQLACLLLFFRPTIGAHLNLLTIENCENSHLSSYPSMGIAYFLKESSMGLSFLQKIWHHPEIKLFLVTYHRLYSRT